MKILSILLAVTGVVAIAFFGFIALGYFQSADEIWKAIIFVLIFVAILIWIAKSKSASDDANDPPDPGSPPSRF